MTEQHRIVKAIFSAVAQVNQELPEQDQLRLSRDTELFGPSATLDSLTLVNLVVNVEQNIEDEFGVPITIADERAVSQKRSPFKTIGTLADYIALLLTEKDSV